MQPGTVRAKGPPAQIQCNVGTLPKSRNLCALLAFKQCSARMKPEPQGMGGWMAARLLLAGVTRGAMHRQMRAVPISITAQNCLL